MSLSAAPTAWCGGAAGFGCHHTPFFVGNPISRQRLIAPAQLLHGRSPARGWTSLGDVPKQPWVLQGSIARGAGRRAAKVHMGMKAGGEGEEGKKGSGVLRSANTQLMRCGRCDVYECSVGRYVERWDGMAGRT